MRIVREEIIRREIIDDELKSRPEWLFIMEAIFAIVIGLGTVFSWGYLLAKIMAGN